MGAYMAYPPFDGSPDTAMPDPPEDGLNRFKDVRFSHAGIFRLCYMADGEKWEELEPSITVLGSEFDNQRFWCVKSLLGDHFSLNLFVLSLEPWTLTTPCPRLAP